MSNNDLNTTNDTFQNNALRPEDLYVEFRVKKKSGRYWIITPDGSDPVFEKVKIDNTIFKALVKAHMWKKYLQKGQFASIRELSEKKKYLIRILKESSG